MQEIQKKLSEIRQSGYNLDFSEVFNHSFNVYKKIALSAGVLILAMSAVFFFIAMFIVAFVAGVGSFTNLLTGNILQVMSPLWRLAYVLGVAVLTGLITPLYAGIINMAYDADRNKDFSISDGFSFYKSKYFGPLFLSAAIVSTATTILSQIGQVLGVEFIAIIFVYIIMIFTILTVPLIIFGNLPAVDSIKWSFIIISKNFWIILGLIIISFICAMLGFVALCIGIIFTMPFIFAMYYSIYVHAVGIDEESEIDEIGRATIERF